MIIINYSASFKALDLYIDGFNDQQENTASKIRNGVILTAKEIIRIYGAFLMKSNRICTIDINNLPPLTTNNAQLAGLLRVSTRTIQRHVKRLEEAGIITDKIWHGSNAGFELFINANLLLTKGENEAEIKQIRASLAKLKETDKEPVAKELTTSCRHTYTCNIKNYTNSLIGVDKGESETDSVKNKTGYTLTGNTEKGKQGKLPERTEKGGQNRRATQPETSGGACRPALKTYVMLLWSLAKNVLYRNVPLTEHQELVAQEMLYQWYAPVQDDKLESVHRSYCERIGLVRKYLDRDPKRYVQLPYLYFDPGNKSGFTATKQWKRVHYERKARTRQKLIVKAQIRKYLRNKEKPIHEQRPPLKVFRECETRIGKLKEPQLLDEFYKAVLDAPYTLTINEPSSLNKIAC